MAMSMPSAGVCTRFRTRYQKRTQYSVRYLVSTLRSLRKIGFMPSQLVDRTVELRSMTASDISLMQELLPKDFEHDPAFVSLPGESRENLRRRWLAQWLEDLVLESSAYPFLVYEKDTPIGFQLLEIEEKQGQLIGDTSSFLIPSARGKRLGVAMRFAVLQFAFESLQVERMISAASTTNIASHKVSERCGYRSLGDFASEYNGHPQTLRRFEITREDWLRGRTPKLPHKIRP